MLEQLHQLASFAQIVVGDTLVDVGLLGDLVQVGSHPTHLLDDASQVLPESFGDHRLLGDVGQCRITQERSHSAVELLGGMRQLEVLVGIEVAGDAVGVGAMHRDGGKRKRGHPSPQRTQPTLRRDAQREKSLGGREAGESGLCW